MRLLMTADAVGGVWQYAMELAAALPHETAVTLAVMGPAPNDGQRAAAAAIAGLQVIETGLPLDWLSDGPAPIAEAGAAVADLAHSLDADIVQVNTPALAAAKFAMPVLAVDHGTLGPWWDAVRGYGIDPALAWNIEATGRGLRAASRVVAPTRAHAIAVARCYDLAVRPDVIHNGRTPLALPASAPVREALTIGRLWDEAKGVRVLDAAAERLNMPFVAIGATEAPHGSTVSPPHLRVLGPQPDTAIAARLAGRPVYVTAARFEPFGLAVLEAAQAGCPLVLSDIPSFRELWDGAARFVRPDDAAGFAEAVAALLDDDAARDAASNAARSRSARYTAQAMARRMDALYRRMLNLPDLGDDRRVA